ncbi:MAG: DUF4386 domain-containing protein, partial [Anaerolineaceae bacterium]|nr:DUF4386 domain-containing protein [Anaerolineaceae bacterium]
LLTVSQIHEQTGVLDTHLQILGDTLISVGDWTSLILGVVFSIGGAMIYIQFYQTRLVPRWLSGWGLIGAALYFAAHLESMFGSQQVLSFDSGLGFLMIPLAIQEMVFAVWMIVRGFNQGVVQKMDEAY